MIVVTGGAGFIGSALVWGLNKEGLEDILIVDHLGSGDKWKNLVNLRFTEYMDKENFLTFLTSTNPKPRIDAIFHMGACSSTIEYDADYLMDNNLAYTKLLADWCISNKVRFIYASSAATYGDGSAGYNDDQKKPHTLKPLNMYAYSKHLFDLYADRNNYFSQITGLKFFNVFGPNEYHKGEMRSLIHKFYPIAQQGKKIKLFKSHKKGIAHGEQQRDFIYIKDIVKAVLFFFKSGQSGLFNVGTGQCHSFNALATAIYNACNKKNRISYVAMPEKIRGKYQYYTRAKTEKLRSAGYNEPFTPFNEAIREYINNYLLSDNPHLH